MLQHGVFLNALVMATPALYLVATPIGNLADITLRSLAVLGRVSLIAAEDTRTTRRLLAAHGLRNRITSFHQHNWRRKLPGLLEHLRTRDVALVSEAGTPGLSDPGYELVVAAIERGITVVPVPGPSALLAALSVSGLPHRQFHYLGYLPSRPGPRRQALSRVAAEPVTLVIFEAPHRIRETLSDILAVLGDRRLAVARELTKLHEEVFRGRVTEAIAHFQEPRGEFTLVLEGSLAPAPGEHQAPSAGSPTPLRLLKEGESCRSPQSGQGKGIVSVRLLKEGGTMSDSDLVGESPDSVPRYIGAPRDAGRTGQALEAELVRCRELGLTARQATALVSQKLGIPRRQVYQAWLRLG